MACNLSTLQRAQATRASSDGAACRRGRIGSEMRYCRRWVSHLNNKIALLAYKAASLAAGAAVDPSALAFLLHPQVRRSVRSSAHRSAWTAHCTVRTRCVASPQRRMFSAPVSAALIRSPLLRHARIAATLRCSAL
jgi:hypothetical protein